MSKIASTRVSSGGAMNLPRAVRNILEVSDSGDDLDWVQEVPKDGTPYVVLVKAKKEEA